MTDRRRFLGALTLALGSIPILGPLLVALRAGLAPAHVDAPDKARLCRVDELPTGDGVLARAISFEVRRGPLVEQVTKPVIVTRDPASGAHLALLGECTHLRCPVQVRRVAATGDDDAPLRCPCHGGRFDRQGRVVDGPPPAPLRRLELEIPSAPGGAVFVRGF